MSLSVLWGGWKYLYGCLAPAETGRWMFPRMAAPELLRRAVARARRGRSPLRQAPLPGGRAGLERAATSRSPQRPERLSSPSVKTSLVL